MPELEDDELDDALPELDDALPDVDELLLALGPASFVGLVSSSSPAGAPPLPFRSSNEGKRQPTSTAAAPTKTRMTRRMTPA